MMKKTIQVRLDARDERRLAELTRKLGWTRSRVVREAIRLAAATYGITKGPRIIGTGEFSSGVTDLATNKKYMEGFGR